MERGIGIRSIYRLEANKVFTSNTTPDTLPGFSQDFVSGQLLHIRGCLIFSLGAVGGIRFLITTPASGTMINSIMVGNTVTPATIPALQSALNTPFADALAVAGTHWLTFEGDYIAVATGTLALQAAQNTTNPSSLTFLAGCFMEIITT